MTALIAFIIAMIILALTVFNVTPSHTGYIRAEDPVPMTRVFLTKYGPTGNPMANGEMPHLGAVAVSDRTIPFGTKIFINNQEYIVKDRTAKWVHEVKGFTVDIYSEETQEEMVRFGRQVAMVEIK